MRVLTVRTQAKGLIYMALVVFCGSASAQHLRRPRTSTSTAPPLYLTSNFAGSPDQPGYAGDGSLATTALLSNPVAIAIDSKGNLYISDSNNHVIREVFAADGTIQTIAGNGTPGIAGDGGPATSGEFSLASSLAVDSAGNLYIADGPNARVRMVNAATGNISTIAGAGGYGYTGDGGPATAANLFYPSGVAVDAAGNVYIADSGNSTVRVVSAATQIITTIAGTGVNGGNPTSGIPGEGFPATAANLDLPYAVAVDESGNIFIADGGTSTIRKIGKDGLIHTIATDVGTTSMVADPAGDLYYADYHANALNKLYPDGTVVTIAGIPGSYGFAGDGGPAGLAVFNGLYSVAFDLSGNIYLADYNNNDIRILNPVPAPNVMVTNGASELEQSYPGVYFPVAPGEVLTIFGTNIGNPTGQTAQPDANGLYETQFAGTTVTFNGIAAPILSSGPLQVSVVAPYEISGATNANIVVSYQGATAASVNVPVAAVSPGIFTAISTGIAGGLPILNSDGSVNSPSNAAVEASNITLFVTGEGLTTPGGVDGLVNGSSNTATPVQPVSVTIGGTSATVVSAAEAPGQVAGVLQVVATLPSSVTTNSTVPVQVQIGGALSQIVTVAVK